VARHLPGSAVGGGCFHFSVSRPCQRHQERLGPALGPVPRLDQGPHVREERPQLGRVEDVVTLDVEVPRSCLKRNRRGVWYVGRDIPFDRVRRIVTFAEVAGAVA
jgi:hypothetical protein